MHVFILEAADGTRFTLREGETTLGRDPSCGVTLSDASVSRLHARVLSEAGQVFVIDGGSRNGTQVNDARIAPNMKTPLNEGAKLTIGNVPFVLRREQKVTSELKMLTQEFSIDGLLPQRGSRDASPALDKILSELLFTAQGALFPAQPVEALLDSLLHLASAFIPSSALQVSLVSQATAALETRATLGLIAPSGAKLISRGVAEKVMQGRRAVLIRDRFSDAEFARSDSLVRAKITSVVAAPIFDGNEVFGVLAAYVVDGATELSEVDVSVLTVLASLAGTALVAANMMSDLMRSQADLLAENERLRRELGDQTRPLGK